MDWLPTITPGRGPLYQQIADAIEGDIGCGRLRRGQQLPTHRALANALGIDLTTVTRAYSDARRRGLVDARVGQGTFISESTLRAARDAAGNVSIDLSMNVPPQPVEAGLDGRILSGLSAVHDRFGLSSLLNYQTPGGSPQDLKAVSGWLRPRLRGVEPERVVIFPGSQAAIFNVLLAALKPGDTVLTEALTYPGLRSAAARLGLRVAGVAMDEEGVIPDALAEAVASRPPAAVYLTPTMHNPTTATMSQERRKAVAEVLRVARVPLIEDDAYGLLDPSRRLLADLLPDQTYLAVGLSKAMAPALRVSFVVAPDAAAARALRQSLQATSQMAAPLMSALVLEWLGSGEAARIVSTVRAEAAGRQQLAARILKGISFAAHPKGHHLWLTLPRGWDRSAFLSDLFRQGLAVVGSEAFCVEGAPPPAVRVCLGAARNRAELATALHVLVSTLRRGDASQQVV